MEKKKELNFSAPLLSVRRYSTPRVPADGICKKVIEKSPKGRQRSLVDRLEWEPEEVTKPAAVPFLWERTPGRPKGECLKHSGKDPAITPRLPPGRLSDAGQRSEVCSPRLPPGRLSDGRRISGEVCTLRLPPKRLSGEVCVSRPSPGRLSGDVHTSKLPSRRLPGEVCSPRLRPGRLTDVRKPSREIGTPRLTSGRLSDVRHISGKLSREQSISKSQTEAFSDTDHASLLESLKDSLHADGETDKDSEEDAFSDALDTLSPTESLSLNCSGSGLRGSCGRNPELPGILTVDPQARDLMMSRFLPATKAAVVESPQYISRKHTMVAEQPKLAKKAIPVERRPSLRHPAFNVTHTYNQYTEDEESEAEEDDHTDTEKRLGKACGFFPRLCVKNSLSLRHPGSGTKLKTQPSTPSLGDVKKLTRNAYSGPLDKRACDAVYRKTYHSGFLSQELHKVGNKLMEEPQRMSFSCDSYKMADGLSPIGRPRSGGISPYRNERPPSPFREGARFLGLPKDVELKADKIGSLIRRDKMFLEVSSQRTHKQGSDLSGDAVEKAMYASTAHNKVMTPANANLNSSKAEKRLNSSSRKFRTTAGSEGVPNYPAAKSSAQDMERLHVLNGLNPDCGSPGTAFLASTCDSEFPGEAHKTEKDNQNQNLDLEIRSLAGGELQGDGNLDVKNERNLKPNGQMKYSSAVLLSPLPPPLPKSPSESWLWRTLRSPFTHSHGSPLQSKKQGHKQASTPGARWETMVKSSKVHHDHVRYSEELLSHTPRQHDRR